MKLRAFLLFLSFSGASSSAKCLPFAEAGQHLGELVCVAGRVLSVSEGNGAFFLNYCADYSRCGFTAVVFSRDLRDVGDVRQLAGKDIEITGRVKEYNGTPEIILNDVKQLRGEASRIPPVPKSFDVARRGSFSASDFHHAKQPRKNSRRARRDRVSGSGEDPEARNQSESE